MIDDTLEQFFPNRIRQSFRIYEIQQQVQFSYFSLLADRVRRI